MLYCHIHPISAVKCVVIQGERGSPCLLEYSKQHSYGYRPNALTTRLMHYIENRALTTRLMHYIENRALTARLMHYIDNRALTARLVY
jgi:hypothetical protein